MLLAPLDGPLLLPLLLLLLPCGPVKRYSNSSDAQTWDLIRNDVVEGFYQCSKHVDYLGDAFQAWHAIATVAVECISQAACCWSSQST